MSAPESDEMRQAPRHRQIDWQGQFDLVDIPQLQGFYPTAILQDS